MCGIAGVMSLNARPVPSETLNAMTAALRHRGPDESSIWIDGPFGFAHTRLSIIDLAASHQPMQSADGRWELVFNGEIFNYRELRAELDYPFRTSGDTETVLAGIALHGIDYLDRLVGQFAFAVADRVTGELHLVRDRMGVLPLYYCRAPDGFVFGSEVKALLPALPRTPEVDLASLDAYLAGRSVPSPNTLFDGVAKLPPAHRAVVAADGALRLVRYWSIPDEDPGERWTAASVADAVDEAVTEAVRAALVADVPVGAYLSGGVDSSLIAATAAALRPDSELHTFAAGFGDPRHDELRYARMVSTSIGSRHHEVTIDASGFERIWPQLTWHRDAPMSEPADAAVFELASAARQVVTVVLSGEGGDELFAGYPKYRAATAVARLARLPAGVRSALVRAVEGRLPERYARERIALRVLGERTRAEQNRAWFAPFTSAERSLLLAGVASRPAAFPAPSGDAIRRMLVGDLAAWLPDNLLERGDRMSMAASLELRPPLLDHRLVELAFRLPSVYKVRAGVTKWALKEVARRRLPAEIVDRRKVGFRVPLDAWFRGGLRDSMWDRLTGRESFVGQTLDRAAVRTLLQRHESGRFNEEARIWTLMSLEVWHETFFRTAAPVAP